jgi:hypothetical protein
VTEKEVYSSGGTPEARSPLFVSQSVSQQLLCLHVEDKPAKKEITSKANSRNSMKNNPPNSKSKTTNPPNKKITPKSKQTKSPNEKN